MEFQEDLFMSFNESSTVFVNKLEKKPAQGRIGLKSNRLGKQEGIGFSCERVIEIE